MTTATLHELAEDGQHSQILRKLQREIDIDVNAKDRFGRTPLQWASEKGHVSTVETLLDMGADLHERDNMGRTAVHLAARSGEADVLEALIGHVECAEVLELVNAADHKGITPVFLARQKGPLGEDAFHLLLKHGAVYNQQIDLARNQSIGAVTSKFGKETCDRNSVKITPVAVVDLQHFDRRLRIHESVLVQLIPLNQRWVKLPTAMGRPVSGLSLK